MTHMAKKPINPPTKLVTALPPKEEEMIALPCCAHKIAVDVDTPVGAELSCFFCGARLLLRGRPGTTARHFVIKE